MTDYATRKATAQRELTKATQSLLGICTGLTADGTLNDAEIVFLDTWIAQNAEVTRCWPGNAIAERLDIIMADGIITESERSELIALLQDISGNEFAETGSAAPAAPAVPYDANATITFADQSFCLTGTFAHGSRATCEALVEQLGGIVADRVNGKLDYLVVGTGISEHWANTTYGRKIETAIERKARYGKPAIIAEADWLAAAKSTTTP